MNLDVTYGITRRLPGTELAAARERVIAALKEQGFGVLTEIDLQATLEKKLGVHVAPYVILGACNPTLAHEALSATLEVGAMLPCNVVIYEGDDGRAVVHAINPMQTIAAAEPQLAKLAFTVQSKLALVLERLA